MHEHQALHVEGNRPVASTSQRTRRESSRRWHRYSVFALALLAGCEGMEEPRDRAESLTLVGTDGAIELKPGEQRAIAVQARNADGSSPVNDVQVFFLLADTAVVGFVDQTDTDLVRTKTKTQTVAGVAADGLASINVRAAEDAGGKSTKVFVGLSSPPETSPESGVSAMEIAIAKPEAMGGAGGNAE
jgi:hypothetical protein